MNKLERLMNLTAALLATERPLSAEELRERVPGYPSEKASFRRAFERDKDDLREMSVPLVLEPVPGVDPPVDGYRIPPDQYYLRDPGLAPDELAALHLAARAVRLDHDSGTGALRKLGSVVDETPGPESSATPIAEVPASPVLARLFDAIRERRLVTFEYKGEARTVEPRRLDLQRGRWYLSGHDRLRDAERHFRIDRIDGELGLGDQGSAPDLPPGPSEWRQPWELGDEPPVTARLRVDADQVGWVRHELGDEAIAEAGDDGSVVFELVVTDPIAFRSFVMTLLEHAEVLAPDELRADVISWLEALAP